KRVADRLGIEAPVLPDTNPAGADPAPAAAVPVKLAPITRDNYETVTTPEALEAWIDRAHATGAIAFDTETTSLNEMQAELVGISFCDQAGRACYIPLGHK